MTEVLPATPEAIRRAVELLKKGQVVALPTETVYGLAGDASSEAALLKIYSVKERPQFDPLIVHVAWDPAAHSTTLDRLIAQGWVDRGGLSSSALRGAQQLIDAHWPGPLTLVLPRGAQVPDLVTSGLPTVALRSPRHPVFQEVLLTSGLALAAPSANRFGRLSPTTAQAVQDELGGRIKLVLDGGECAVGVESTVVAVDAQTGGLTLLRPGGLPAEKLPPLQMLSNSGSPTPASPGLLASHYAPQSKLELCADASELQAHLRREAHPEQIAVLGYRSVPLGNWRAQAILSPTGDAIEAARTLFQKLRTLDAQKPRLIVAELPPTRQGLEHAIADRLARAAAPRT